MQPTWWGTPPHKLYTVVIFVILASLDNAAIGILPPLYALIAPQFQVSEAAIGLITAARVVVTAIFALLWGYWGDQRQRKPLLLYGTVIWSVALFLCGWAENYWQLLGLQIITAIGVGGVASLGFSVVNDFIPPARRGMAMSLWGLAQGMGWATGALMASILGAENWRWPFWVIAACGLLFALLYLFTYEPLRGHTEPELAKLFAQGRDYAYRIDLATARQLWRHESNFWLIWQGFIAMICYGSTLWLPRFFTAKVQAEGYSLEVATIAGAIFTMIFQLGGYFALVAGHLGDMWQQRDRRGRALLSTIGLITSIPCTIASFFIPLHNLNIPDPTVFAIADVWGLFHLIMAVCFSLITNGWVMAAFIVAFVAVSLSSIDLANRPALLTDVNLPEHRGTMIGLAILANGLGFALGNALSGVAFETLAPLFSPPMNYVIGLSLFQLFLIPASYCYWKLIDTSPHDIETVQRLLRERGEGK